MIYINDQLGAIIIKKCCDTGLSIREVIENVIPHELDHKTRKQLKKELKANQPYLNYHFEYSENKNKEVLEANYEIKYKD